MEEYFLIKEECPYYITKSGIVKTKGFTVTGIAGPRETGEKILKPCIRNGYLSYRLKLTDKHKWYTSHRLVALTFIPNPNNYPQVNHMDGNRLNNEISNLEWCTASHNTKHAYNTGLLKPACNRKGFVGKEVHNSIPVVQLTKEGEYVKTWESFSLTKLDGFTASCVGRVCSKELKQHKGFLWMYETEYEQINSLKNITL